MTSEVIHELFTYDSSTGALLWKRRPHARSPQRPGYVAGCVKSRGYCQIHIQGKSYQRSHLVWLYVTGQLPVDEIDHINHNPTDDRIENLRPASRSQQLANRRQMGHNTSGYRGVYFDPRKQRWAARISIFGKRKRLGTFETPEEASAVVDQAGREAYGEYWFAEVTKQVK